MAQKIVLDKRTYLPPPVPNGIAVKRALAKAGYQIIDIQFAPPGYELPQEVREIIHPFYEGMKDPAPTSNDEPPQEPAQPSAQPESAAPPSNTAGSSESPAQPEATGESGGEQQDSGQQDTLLGSSVLESTYEIGSKTVQLGDIVAAAHTASGLTLEAWNAQPDEEREHLLKLELEKMQAEASATKTADQLTDAELRAAIEAKTGQKPAWNAKRETLIAQFNAVSA
jgi:hypothetical protein